jgi:hypothetical protein
MGETRESAERAPQASAKFLQLGCGEAPFWNDLNSLPFSKKDESAIILDTSPKGCPVYFHGTLLSSELNSVAVNIEKKLPMQMFGLPVKFLE